MEYTTNRNNSKNILQLIYDQCIFKDSKNGIKKFNYIKTILENLNIIDIEKNSIVYSFDNFLLNQSPITLPRYYNEYKEIEKIGSGGFGKVFKSLYFLDQKIYAIKKILISPNNIKNLNDVIKEITILSRLEHPNIVRYYTSWAEPYLLLKDSSIKNLLSNNNVALIKEFEELSDNGSSNSENDTYNQEHKKYDLVLKKQSIDLKQERHNYKVMFYIQTELCCKENLSDFLINRNSINISENINIIKQLVEGISYIHHLNIIHDDLKPSNILFSKKNVLKITDFGLSKFSNSQINNDKYYGTFLYKDPHTKIVIKQNDIYSLGVIIFELFSDFQTQMERFLVLSKLKENIIDEKFVKKYPKIHQIVKKCINPNFQERLSIDYFKKIEKFSLH